MPRLMDIGLEKLRNMVLDMAELSQNTVSTAIDAYVQGRDLRERIFGWSEELRMLQDEVSELAVEIIARYQPVASDLRFIKSCMEVSYGFSDRRNCETWSSIWRNSLRTRYRRRSTLTSKGETCESESSAGQRNFECSKMK